MGNNNSSSLSLDHGNSSTSTITAETATGRHVLHINGYSKIKGAVGAGNCIESESFTVGGHSWCISYYPDGENETNGAWSAVYLRLKKGPTSCGDGVVKARFKISLLDRKGQPVPKYRFGSSRSFSATSDSWGCDQFVKAEGVLVEGSKYLKDDCFSIGCEVTVVECVSRLGSGARTQFVKVPPSRFLFDLLSGLGGADVILDVGGEAFSAHRSILASRSSVFKGEILRDLKEITTDARVQIKDMEPSVFRAMLHYVYNDSLPAMAVGEDAVVMARRLLVAADRYDLKRLKLICEDLLCNHVNKITAAAALVFADQHGCQGLKDACFAFLASRDNKRRSWPATAMVISGAVARSFMTNWFQCLLPITPPKEIKSRD